MRALGTLFLLCAVTVPCAAQDIGLSTGSVQRRSGDESGFWLDVPFFPQQENGCGASSLAMILQYWNSVPAADPQSIFSSLYSEELRGIPASRMKTYLEEKRFRAFAFAGTLPDLKEHLLKGRPLIVALGGSSLHYVVVVGLDELKKVVLLNDPAVKKLSNMDRGDFLTAWKQTNFWTLLAVPDAPR